MNAPIDAPLQHSLRLHQAIEAACERIAPTWPLDQLIAVNPYWGWRDLPPPQAAARLGALGGAVLTAPREVAAAAWRRGELHEDHLRQALDLSGSTVPMPVLLQALHSPAPLPRRLPLASDLATGGLHATLPVGDAVVHQVSQHCAAFFDDGQSGWPLDRADGLFGTWRTQLVADRGLRFARGRAWLAEQVAQWPADPQRAIAAALETLGMPPAQHTPYLTALLLSINGWAAWCAWQRWQARLHGADDDALEQLLAIRTCWEALLHVDAVSPTLHTDWRQQWAACDAAVDRLAAAQQADWVLQLALELAWQRPVAAQLSAAPVHAATVPAWAQAVFCIDVRSEVFRRALEGADAGVHTRGFAGFFGLPIAYAPAGSALTRPQLPGLLAPAQTVSEAEADTPLASALRSRRQAALQWQEHWRALRRQAGSGFSFVEACGLAYGGKLLADSLPGTGPAPRWEASGLPTAGGDAAPRLAASFYDGAAGADLAAPILRAMGLTHDFAPLVLLAGHGSQTANNPHAAGLDCGACGGQAGDVNARVLAGLLNAPAVRAVLAERGIVVPAGTWFVAGLHNTTTDDVTLFDTQDVPASHREALARLRTALAAAGDASRAERAAGLGLQHLAGQPQALGRAVRQRANDWSQVRPEWGLADNAAFIVAPRARTRHMRLGGRAFLHDYDHRQDADRAVLTLIMTAPMVVTNWINLQYHASTVDPQRYGAGNKLLHNVVGGHIGVFEGNGGDLRIGLPLQSVHDGERWRHTPLRLSVFIEAPREAIEGVIAQHAVVQALVGNGWLHLLRIDPDSGAVERHTAGRWSPVAGA